MLEILWSRHFPAFRCADAYFYLYMIGACCYRQHILRVVIYDTVWIFRARVVIPDTGQNRCYLRHISEKRPVVIPDTVSAWVVILDTVVVGCKRGHNLWWLCAEFQRLLFTAQFGFLVCGLLRCAQISPCVVSLGIVCPVVRHGTLFCRAQLCG